MSAFLPREKRGYGGEIFTKHFQLHSLPSTHHRTSIHTDIHSFSPWQTTTALLIHATHRQHANGRVLQHLIRLSPIIYNHYNQQSPFITGRRTVQIAFGRVLTTVHALIASALSSITDSLQRVPSTTTSATIHQSIHQHPQYMHRHSQDNNKTDTITSSSSFAPFVGGTRTSTAVRGLLSKTLKPLQRR